MKPLLYDKAILVVEDYAPMRKSIRDMLHTLSADNIAEADNAISALALLEKTDFDVVLCDYNLGPGQNGQQLLEEVRHRRLLNPRAIFIIITAEQTTDMVLGAMDSKPDEYLTKPFNTQQLFNRIERNYLRKKDLWRIESEIEKGNLLTAISYCQHLLDQGDPKRRTQLLKLRAEMAIAVGDFNTAKRIYQDILEKRELPWARLGLAMVEFEQGNTETAITNCENLIAENPLFLDSYDWLSGAFESLHQSTNAEQVLSQAVDLSPLSIRRQKRLAETADRNGNIETAEHAYRATVNLGKYSVYRSSSDFSNLAKLYARKNDPQQALKILQQMRHEYSNDPEAELRATTLEADLHKTLGNEGLAKLAFSTALELYRQQAGTLPKDVELDMVRSCFLHDQSKQGQAMLESLIKSHVDDDGFMNDLRRMQNDIGMLQHSEKLIQSTKRQLVAINNQGVGLYKQGKFQEAMSLFEQAMHAMPNNKTIILNMLKIMVLDLKAGAPSIDKFARVQTLMNKAKQLAIPSHKLGGLQIELANQAKILKQGTPTQ